MIHEAMVLEYSGPDLALVELGSQMRLTVLLGLDVAASEEMVLYIVGLPPVLLPEVASDQFDTVTSDGAIEFENPRKRATV